MLENPSRVVQGDRVTHLVYDVRLTPRARTLVAVAGALVAWLHLPAAVEPQAAGAA